MKLKKSLGQHFLRDKHVSQKIVDLLQIEANDNIIEIGPGAGALTDFISSSEFNSFTIIEKDNHFAALHAEKLANRENCKVLNMDAMDYNWSEIEGDIKIISNLPYNVASPLIWDIVSQVPNLKQAVFMVQKEVAERIIAPIDTKDYGALSVWVQSYAEVEWGFVVKPNSFTPPPKVDSAVIRLNVYDKNALSFDARKLNKLLRLCFQQRRKQIQGILKKSGISSYSEILDEIGVAQAARPENLTCLDFHNLAKKIN